MQAQKDLQNIGEKYEKQKSEKEQVKASLKS